MSISKSDPVRLTPLYDLYDASHFTVVMTSTFVLSDDKKKDDFSTSHGLLPMEERVNIWDVSLLIPNVSIYDKIEK